VSFFFFFSVLVPDILMFAFIALFVYSAVWIFPGMLDIKLGRLNYYLSGRVTRDLHWST
jgi:hypothetical protein